MSTATTLTIVIPTVHGGVALYTTLHSILQQQSAPTFEVLVVCNTPNSELERELRRLDKRISYLCSGEIGVNYARNLGLKRAHGETVLFLDDDVWIEDKLFLKRHVDSHVRSPEAIAIGGRYTLKRGAGLFETAYHWLSNFTIEHSRVNESECTQLHGGNSSFKTEALRSAFAFDAEVDFGGSATELHQRLAAAGHKLVFHERLELEHRVRMGAREFVRRCYLLGRADAYRTAKGIQPQWTYFGANTTLNRYMQERAGRMTRSLRFAFWLSAVAFTAGRTDAALAGTKWKRHVTRVEALRAVAREINVRARKWARTPLANEMFLSLRYLTGNK